MNTAISHSAAKPKAANTDPHETSIRSEAWRGAKFGAKAMPVVLICLGDFSWRMMLSVACYVWYSAPTAEVLPDPGGPIEIIKGLTIMILGLAVYSVFGAILGAAIMGWGAFMRKRHGPA